MKCVKLNGIRQLELSETEKPVSNNGSVVFKVNSCGICGSDIHNWNMGSPVGLILGHEFAGEVIDPGSRTDLKIGDRITGLPISPCGTCEACRSANPQYCVHTWSHAVGLSLDNSGGYAEYSSCRPDMVKIIPDNVTDDEACITEPSAVALHAINLADIKIGDKVLIIGGGIIGLMSAEFAKLNGASYIALLETNEARGKKALKYGKVDEYYNALEDGIVDKLTNKTDGGFDKVIECCGNTAAVTEAINCAKYGGTIILVGVSYQPITIPSLSAVLGEKKLQGAIAYTELEFERCLELISKKVINVKKYIDDKIQLGKAQSAFERLTSGKDDAIKIIFKP